MKIKRIVFGIGLMFLLMSFQQINCQNRQSVKTDTNSSNLPPEWIDTEQMPTYPGGERELLKFVEKNLDKTIVNCSNLSEGRVIIRFSIDTLGNAIDFTVYKSYNNKVDNECLRVLKLMPKWKPAETWTGNKNDSFKKTKIGYTFPIKIPFKGYNLEK
jgi:hypothetical protein